MVPSYDFDIKCLVPRDVKADPAIGALLDGVGLNSPERGAFIALFRDPDMIETIAQADPALRAYLKASGFGFTVSRRDLPAGSHAAREQAAREQVVTWLEANRARFDLRDTVLGGFDLAAFSASIAQSTPVSEDTATPDPVQAAPPEPAAAALPVEPPPKRDAHHRVLPLMVLSLATALGAYRLIEILTDRPMPF